MTHPFVQIALNTTLSAPQRRRSSLHGVPRKETAFLFKTRNGLPRLAVTAVRHVGASRSRLTGQSLQLFLQRRGRFDVGVSEGKVKHIVLAILALQFLTLFEHSPDQDARQ